MSMPPNLDGPSRPRAAPFGWTVWLRLAGLGDERRQLHCQNVLSCSPFWVICIERNCRVFEDYKGEEVRLLGINICIYFFRVSEMGHFSLFSKTGRQWRLEWCLFYLLFSYVSFRNQFIDSIHVNLTIKMFFS
ncbi:hypothetical protein Ddye_009421 [Dipteronia dyeriana]|uniref:Uncharacterized protein n=1 Tax=Dipteronia dyeriana TaxID=168575 RepID=A0AAD9XBI1_9ROSI|nr:hypothetical protein Ddye_009421 [Dipteronia dyeriana]